MNNGGSFDDIITCRNCGTINMKGTKRCVRCGKRLRASKKGDNSFINFAATTTKPNNKKSNNNKNSNNDLIAFMASGTPASQNRGPFSVNSNKTIHNENVDNSVVSVNNNNQSFTNIKQEKKVVENVPADKINYVSYLINSFLKPFDKYRDEEANFNLMNTGILLGIMSIVLSIVSLFAIVMNVIRVNPIFSDKVVWKVDRLANINYFKILFVNIFMFAGILVGIALVYYFASSIILKKKTNLFRLLGATITAFVPLVVAIFVGQVLALISSFFGLAIASIGGIYAFMILIGLMNYNIDIDNDDKSSFIYFNSICLSIVVLIIGPIFYNVIASFFSGFIA